MYYVSGCQKFEIGLMGLKGKSRAAFLLEALGRILPCLLQLLEDAHMFLAQGHIAPTSASTVLTLASLLSLLVMTLGLLDNPG